MNYTNDIDMHDQPPRWTPGNSGSANDLPTPSDLAAGKSSLKPVWQDDHAEPIYPRIRYGSGRDSSITGAANRQSLEKGC